MTIAAISKVLSVRPLIGLLELPRRPTRYPATAANRNPRMTIIAVNKTAPPRLWLKYQYRPNSGTDNTAIATPVFLKLTSRV